jgi:hypothetical protein
MLRFHKEKEFLMQLSDCQLLKKGLYSMELVNNDVVVD